MNEKIVVSYLTNNIVVDTTLYALKKSGMVQNVESKALTEIATESVLTVDKSKAEDVRAFLEAVVDNPLTKKTGDVEP